MFFIRYLSPFIHHSDETVMSEDLRFCYIYIVSCDIYSLTFVIMLLGY